MSTRPAEQRLSADDLVVALRGSPTSNERDRLADERDTRADAHDAAAAVRDQRAVARDKRAEARDRQASWIDTGVAADRAEAARDSQASATDRARAADDRRAAASERHLSAQERSASSIDELTGAYQRDAGMTELKRELVRAKRTQRSLVLAFVDLDGLKDRNDSLGHVAGDDLLHRTVESIQSHLRPYDLVVRFGGDEFVCAFLDVDMAEATKRFDAVSAELTEAAGASISVGLAQMRPEDSLGDLITRADAALYSGRTIDLRSKRGSAS